MIRIMLTVLAPEHASTLLWHVHVFQLIVSYFAHPSTCRCSACHLHL